MDGLPREVSVRVINEGGCVRAVADLGYGVGICVRHSPIWVSRRGTKSGRAHVCEVYRPPIRASLSYGDR
jgi:hypothetical protein